MTIHETLASAEAQLDMTQYEDPMERVLQRALRDVRSTINSCTEHRAKYPTVGRDMTERRLARAEEEEQVILSCLALRQAALSLKEG